MGLELILHKVAAMIPSLSKYRLSPPRQEVLEIPLVPRLKSRMGGFIISCNDVMNKPSASLLFISTSPLFIGSGNTSDMTSASSTGSDSTIPS